MLNIRNNNTFSSTFHLSERMFLCCCIANSLKHTTTKSHQLHQLFTIPQKHRAKVTLYKNTSCLTYLTFHRISIKLTHITTSILFGYRFDVQIPCILIRVCYTNSWIVSDYVLMNRLDCFCVCFQPSNLLGETKRPKIIQMLHSSQHHRFFFQQGVSFLCCFNANIEFRLERAKKTTLSIKR